MEEMLLGVTDRTILVFIPDSASTTGTGKTGLAHSAITVSYTRVETDNDVVVNDVTSSMNALTNLTDAHNDWGWKEVSSTVAPGLYRLDLADAVFASGAWYAVVQVCVTSGLAAATPKAFRLVAVNALDGVRGGMTALPNAAAEAAGGLYTRGTGAGQINQTNNGRVDTDVQSIANNSITAAAIATGAIDADAIADNAIDAGALAADCITAAKIADGAIDAGAIASDTFTAAKFAADCFTAAKFAADVTTEFQSGLATAAALTTVSGKIDTIDDFLDTEIAAILADTNELQTDWADGGRLDLILDARASQTSVNTIDDFLDTEIAAILADTNELQTDWADGGRLDLILDSRASQSSLDTLDNFVDTEVAAIKSVTDKLDTMLELNPTTPGTAGDYRYLREAVETVWDVAMADHLFGGSTGAALNAAGSAGDPWTTPLPGAYTAGTAGYIVGTNLDAKVSEVGGGSAPTAAEIADAVWDEAQSGHVSAGSFGEIATEIADILVDTGTTLDGKINTIDDFLDTEIAAIKAKTDNLPSDPADASDIAASFTTVNTKLDTIDDLLDTEVAAIKTVVDSNATKLDTIDDFLDTEIAAIKAKTDSLTFTTANRVDCQVYGMQADTLTASALAASAVTEIQSGLSTHTAADVWAVVTRTLTAIDEDTTTLDLDATIRASVGLASANLDTQLDTIDNFLDTEIAAIKAKTDNLPADPADASDIAASFTTVNTKLDTIDDLLDTEVAAIKTVVDSNATKLDTIDDFLDTEVAAIKAKTDNLPSDPADASVVQASTDALAAQLVKVLAAVYDTATVSGNVITLSNGATLTVTGGGRVRAGG